jgi:hypothetical protein
MDLTAARLANIDSIEGGKMAQFPTSSTYGMQPQVHPGQSGNLSGTEIGLIVLAGTVVLGGGVGAVYHNTKKKPTIQEKAPTQGDVLTRNSESSRGEEPLMHAPDANISVSAPVPKAPSMSEACREELSGVRKLPIDEYKRHLDELRRNQAYLNLSERVRVDGRGDNSTGYLDLLLRLCIERRRSLNELTNEIDSAPRHASPSDDHLYHLVNYAGKCGIDHRRFSGNTDEQLIRKIAETMRESPIHRQGELQAMMQLYHDEIVLPRMQDRQRRHPGRYGPDPTKAFVNLAQTHGVHLTLTK